MKITVKQIPTEAVDKSIAVRLKGISRESFLIILPEFKDAVSDFLSTKVENVKLFSIQDATAGGTVKRWDQSRLPGKPPTHPSLEPKDKPSPNLDSNFNLREGWVGHVPEIWNDPKRTA